MRGTCVHNPKINAQVQRACRKPNINTHKLRPITLIFAHSCVPRK